ncbi:MAG: hypothetical protein O6765_06065, partial [Gammaproteobacteria bacterium]|nr:hypothetical protein [Gammaproteobacteria bacterium]
QQGEQQAQQQGEQGQAGQQGEQQAQQQGEQGQAGQQGTESRQAQGDSADQDVFGDGTQIGSDGQMANAEDAFNRSLEEFDAIMGDEREAMARAGVGSAADDAFGAAGDIGKPVDAHEMPVGEGAQGVEDGAETNNPLSVFENRSEAERTAAQIEGCDDQDKVARQLCEAATEENDPFLRAALWDEYNEYKKIIVRR